MNIHDKILAIVGTIVLCLTLGFLGGIAVMQEHANDAYYDGLSDGYEDATYELTQEKQP